MVLKGKRRATCMLQWGSLQNRPVLWKDAKVATFQTEVYNIVEQCIMSSDTDRWMVGQISACSHTSDASVEFCISCTLLWLDCQFKPDGICWCHKKSSSLIIYVSNRIWPIKFKTSKRSRWTDASNPQTGSPCCLPWSLFFMAVKPIIGNASDSTSLASLR